VVLGVLVGITGCGIVESGTTEYNELVALVQGVQSAASNFQMVTDTQYAKIQAKTQITKDYYDAVNKSGEVWTGNFRMTPSKLTTPVERRSRARLWRASLRISVLNCL
jgi:hypothetical protein